MGIGKVRWRMLAALTVLTAIFCPVPTALGQGVQEPTPGQQPPLPPRLPFGVPAFPGAWGGGMFSTGGRGGKVIEVTNLKDAGPGSLRAAIDAEGARIVVFRVAGIVKLESHLEINHPDITIAGQTAPGDGVCIADRALNINTHNVILRHLRVRGPAEPVQRSLRGAAFFDCIGGYPRGNIVIDHCTTSWGSDENLSLYRYMEPRPDLPKMANGSVRTIKEPVRNLTIQWCISSEARTPATHGATWGGEDATFHHNLFASNGGRNPSIGMGGEFDYRNNVIFNWTSRTVDGGDETAMINVINNYYKPGPATNDNMISTIARIEQRNSYSPGNRWEAGGWYSGTPARPGKWYVAGNIVEGAPEVTANNWAGMRGPEDLARVNTPFEAWPMHQQTAREAYASVLAKAGATLPRRDAIDKRIVESVRTGKTTTPNGIITDPKEVGGYIDYAFKPEEVPADGDHDGMPDAWETKNGLNPAAAADGSLDADNDGYTNVEEFMNGTNPKEAVDYSNLGNNVDTIS